MTTEVGKLSARVASLLGLHLQENQPILLGDSNISHMLSRPPAAYAKYGQYIPLILASHRICQRFSNQRRICKGGGPAFRWRRTVRPISVCLKAESCAKLHCEGYPKKGLTNCDIKFILYLHRGLEDGTGSRRPLLGDVGVSPHLILKNVSEPHLWLAFRFIRSLNVEGPVPNYLVIARPKADVAISWFRVAKPNNLPGDSHGLTPSE